MPDADDWAGDVVVVGAGPAGLAAARELGAAGLDVLLVDENHRAGGQIWRQRFTDPDRPQDDPLTHDLGPRVRLLPDAVCHGGAPDDLLLTTASGVVRARPRATVVACGSVERAVPVPGWTLPGVMTAGAAQTFLKGSGVLPFRRVVVAGTGPLLLATAAQLVRAGADVVALVEAAGPGPADWRHAGRLLAAPELLAEGAQYLAVLARAGVRPRTRTAVTRVEGEDAVTGARLSRLRDDWTVLPSEPELVPCDAVLLSPGFASNVELTSQLGARVVWDDQRQTWTPWRDADLRTTARDTWAVGDCAGVGGVKVAALEGTVAGLALAAELTHRDVEPDRLRRARRRLSRFETFRAGMDAIFRPRDGSATWADDDTVVCRCEGTTAAQVRRAVAAGATDLHGIKLRTRAGMGPCQGRVCSPPVAEQVLHDTGARPLPPPARFPVRPLPVAAVTAAIGAPNHERQDR